MRFLACSIVTAVLVARADAALAPVASFGANPGALDMYEYVPATLHAGRPLVVVLHGCTQTAAAMEVAGWNALADANDFAVIYPQQRSANQQLDCFTWYTAADIARTGGEAESIIHMVDTAIATHGSDPARVYVTGLSAGGAMTSVLLAAYPDRVRAGSVMSGLPYACATDVTSATACTQMSASSQRSAAQWGDLVRAADPGFAGERPRVQIWQGTSDYTVAPANATELVKQWTDVWGTDATADATDAISTATRTRYLAGSTIAVELYLVTGMGHAIATGSDALGACPATTGAYFADEHICSTLRAAQFFELVPGDNGSGSGSGSDPGSTMTADGSCATTGGTGSSVAILLAFVLALRSRRNPASRLSRAVSTEHVTSPFGAVRTAARDLDGRSGATRTRSGRRDRTAGGRHRHRAAA